MASWSTVIPFLLLLQGPLTSVAVAPPEGHDLEQLHGPIRIVGDDAFVVQNGVIQGTGTESNPYIIRGWTIYAIGSSGVALVNTTKHVIIERNVIRGAFFDSAEEYSAGVKLINVANAVVRDNVLDESQFGVHVRTSRDILVSQNVISGIQIPMQSDVIISNGGVHLIDSERVAVSGNDIHSFGWGITVEGDGGGIVLQENIIADTILSGAINLLYSVSHVAVSNNSISNAKAGIFVLGVSNVSLEGNSIVNVANGFDLDALIIGGVWHPAQDVTASGNTVEEVGYLGLIGDCNRCYVTSNLLRNSSNGLSAYGGSEIEIKYNIFEGNEIVFPEETDPSASIHHNAIDLSNQRYAHVIAGTLDLRHNWWDGANGPDMDRFLLEGDGAVLVSPWLATPP